MNRFAYKLGRALISTALLAMVLVACKDTVTTPPATTSYATRRLVADIDGTGAAITDSDLVNPWGLAFGPTGILWVSNNHTGTSTLYDADGTRHALVVSIPTASASTGGSPTGVIYNGLNNFTIAESGPALFIFAGEDGTISAWNGGPSAVLVADRSPNQAVYKGIASATNGSSNFLYLTNFKMGSVDMFDGSFHFVKSFTDPSIPAGFAPFGIQTIGNMLYVTYAKQKGPDNEDDEVGLGNGYVDVFNADGSLARHFASTGMLNSPWGIAVAPAGFGTHSGDILIGNFGDGAIGAYNPTTGAFTGLLHDAGNAAIVIPGLWGLTFGPGANATTLYYSAGPSEENHGVLGTLKPM